MDFYRPKNAKLHVCLIKSFNKRFLRNADSWQ